MIKPQVGRVTGINEQVQAYRPTGLIQTHKLIATGEKTTILPPHRRNTENYKVAATQATKFTSLPPHR